MHERCILHAMHFVTDGFRLLCYTIHVGDELDSVRVMSSSCRIRVFDFEYVRIHSEDCCMRVMKRSY